LEEHGCDLAEVMNWRINLEKQDSHKNFTIGVTMPGPAKDMLAPQAG